MLLLLLLLLPEVRSDISTPSSLLGSRKFNRHPFDAVKFVKAQPVKKGPILFPNDGPPPPPTPLIVTSRPLYESIARSELNPNNSLAAQSQLNHVAFRPSYLSSIKNYQPFAYTATVTPVYDGPTPAPYSDLRNFEAVRSDHFYSDYEKLLTDTIQRRKLENEKRERWERPIYRRRLEKIPFKTSGRRVLFEDEDKSKNIKVWHSSLYSREAHDYDVIAPNRRDYGANNDIRRPILRSKYSESISEEIHRRPLNHAETARQYDHESLSQDFYNHKPLQQRSVRPLYSLSERLNGKLKTHQKPIVHDPYQFPLKTHDPYDEHQDIIRPSLSPDYSHYGLDKGHKEDYNHGDNYAFSYTVKDQKTGDDFSHSQQSKGSATNGEYRVRLPDGRMQIVLYTADENGYKADVRYDDHHNVDNSIDFEASKEHPPPNTYPAHRLKSFDTRSHYNEQTDSNDFEGNKEFLNNLYKNERSYNQHQNINFRASDRHEDFTHKHEHNVPGLDNDYPDHNVIDNHKNDGLTDNNDEYLDNYIVNNGRSGENANQAHDTDYFHYADEIPFSKEIKDYSSELNAGYQPHKSKYSSFTDNTVKSTVKPSFDDLKDLFVTSVYRRGYDGDSSVSSTFKPQYETSTDKVVVISPKNNLYTNIRDLPQVTPSPLPYSTPRGYLLSTIANLKSQVNLGSKPVLSSKYIDKINKYLTY